ncbi:MAG TPA: hypothetical protein PKC39_15985 [Ferruginibacter sp.]|nr:hypothetical protein [Ferruginibacter sp.]
MKEVFASIYEWFGLLPLYSRDFGDHLRGWDITCSDYIGTPWYNYIGWLMILVTCLFYALQYHIIDSPRWNKKRHWWIFALVMVAINYLIAFSITFNSLQAGDYCNQLNISVYDCLGFALSNASWTFIIFLLISSTPLTRRLSTNCRHTTFWKP